MAAIRPHPTHSGWYVVDCYPEGRKGKRERLVCKSYEKAVAISESLTGAYTPDVVHPKLSMVVEDYLQWVRKYQAAQTYKNKAYRLGKFIIPALGQYRVKDLNQTILDRYNSNLTPSMVRMDIIHLMAMIRWMRKRNLADRLTWDPELPPVSSKIKPLPPPAGVLATIAAIEPENVRMLFTLQLYTGLRPREVKNLRWENYRHDAFLMTVSKTKELQTIPVPAELRPWFDKHEKTEGFVFESRVKKGKPWHNLYNFIDKASKATGYKLSPHMIRHCSGTFLLEANGGDIYEVKNHLRHSRVSTSEIYLRYSATRKQTATKSIYDYVNPHE